MHANDSRPERPGVIDRVRAFFDRLFGRPSSGRWTPVAATAAVGGAGGQPVGRPPGDASRDSLAWGRGAA